MEENNTILLDANKILKLVNDATRDFIKDELGEKADLAKVTFSISPEWKVITFTLQVSGCDSMVVADHDPCDVIVSIRREMTTDKRGEAAITFLDLIFCLECADAHPGTPEYGKLSRERIEAQAQLLADVLIGDLREPDDR